MNPKNMERVTIVDTSPENHIKAIDSKGHLVRLYHKSFSVVKRRDGVLVLERAVYKGAQVGVIVGIKRARKHNPNAETWFLTNHVSVPEARDSPPENVKDTVIDTQRTSEERNGSQSAAPRRNYRRKTQLA